MEWKDLWKEEPPRNEEIFFMTGDEEVHIGEIFSVEKLRKCKFHSFNRKEDYECDSLTPYEDRVIYWFPVPIQPERSKREDVIIYVCSEENECNCPFPYHSVFETECPLKAIQFLNEKGIKDRIIQTYTRCGALNSMET